MKIYGVLLCLSLIFVSCAKDKSSSSSAAALSAEAKMFASASNNIDKSGSNSNGSLNGTTTTPGSAFVYNDRYRNNFAVDFDIETGCKSSGQLDETIYDEADALFPFFNIYCGLRKSPNGPDTARGAIDRVSGFMCAIGSITYDGVAVTKNISISTTCFQSGFVSMVQDELGTTTFPATITGYTGVTGIAPSGFTKYVTIELASISKIYTVAALTTTTEKAFAVYNQLPSSTAGNEAFAVYMNQSTGVVKVEGRFSEHNRHFRMHTIGTLSTDFEITNVLGLHYVNGETNDYLSLSGTPAAGRKLKFDNYATGKGHAGDNACYGEDTKDCSANAGIVIEDAESAVYSLAGGHTTAANWFKNNSFLGGTGDLTANPDADVWPAAK